MTPLLVSLRAVVVSTLPTKPYPLNVEINFETSERDDYVPETPRLWLRVELGVIGINTFG